MLDFVFGIALIAALVFFWEISGRSRPGRVVQAMIASLAYLAWLSIIPLIVYFVTSSILESADQGRIGAAAFVAVISLTLIPVMIFPLIPWNYYCIFVWRKTGLRLPQSERLASHRAYYDAERER